MKSSPPKNTAVTAVMAITITVYLMVSLRVGQLTFFISSLTSFRKFIILSTIFVSKNAPRGYI